MVPMGEKSKEVSVALMVVVVARKRMFWLLSGTRGAGVEHTTRRVRSKVGHRLIWWR